jgi:hypothetical protein
VLAGVTLVFNDRLRGGADDPLEQLQVIRRRYEIPWPHPETAVYLDESVYAEFTR